MAVPEDKTENKDAKDSKEAKKPANDVAIILNRMRFNFEDIIGFEKPKAGPDIKAEEKKAKETGEILAEWVGAAAVEEGKQALSEMDQIAGVALRDKSGAELKDDKGQPILSKNGLLSEESLKDMGKAKDFKDLGLYLDETKYETEKKDFEKAFQDNKHIENAQAVVAKIKTQASAKIDEFKTGKVPKSTEWKEAFEAKTEMDVFNKSINDHIKQLEHQKVNLKVDHKDAPDKEADLTKILDAQIESLKSFQTKFKEEIDKQKDERILKRMEDAKPDISKYQHPGLVSGAGNAKSTAERDALIAKQGKALTIKELARRARYKRRNLEALIWNETEKKEFNVDADMKDPKAYVINLKGSHKAFEFTEDGIRFKKDAWYHFTRNGKEVENFNALLNVFYAETGADPAYLSAEKGVSYDFLLKLAQEIEKRHDPKTHPDPLDRKPTVIMDDETIKALTETMGGIEKEGAREKISPQKKAEVQAKIEALKELMAGGQHKTAQEKAEDKNAAVARKDATAVGRAAP